MSKLAATLLAGAFTAGDAVNLRSLRSSSNRTSLASEDQSLMMDTLYPFYHTTDSIRDQLSSLASNCPGMTLSVGDSGDDRSIDVVTIKDPDSTPINRNFLLFGEHARELISPESGLHFIRTLCGGTELSARAKEILKDNEFQIVVNGNPSSRRKVEQGDFCLRVNPNGVDLNRNWDEEWQAGEDGPQQTNPGPSAFSESETKIFRGLVEEYKPTTFLTVHSGTKGMYMPWAYDMEHLATRNEPQMMQILKTLDKDHCECPFGAAGREVGYSCPGTCLDWVYDHMKSSYSFAFEIYTDPSSDADLKARWEEKMQETSDSAFLQENSLAHSKFKDLFEKHPSCFVQTASEKHSHHRYAGGMSPEDCFAQFNPNNEEEYNKVVNNWSGAYLDMADLVTKNMKAGDSGDKAPVAAPAVEAASATAAPAVLVASDAAPAAPDAAETAASDIILPAASSDAAPAASEVPGAAADDPTANASAKMAALMGYGSARYIRTFQDGSA